MAITNAEFLDWVERDNRREWLLEADYVWPTWRVGTRHDTAGATGGQGQIKATPQRPVDTPSLTAATNYYLPTTPQTLPTATAIMKAGGVTLYVLSDRGLRVTGIDASLTSVTQDFTGPLVSLDTLHAIRLEVDRSADLVRVYVDGTQVGSSVDISTLGAFSTNSADGQDLYSVFPSFFVHIEGVQGWDRLLATAELAALNTPTPPARINGWAEVIVPTAESYINASSQNEVEAQYIDLLQNNAVSYLVSELSQNAIFVASPASTAGPYTARYSLGGYITTGADTPADTPYDARLITQPVVTHINQDLIYGITTERMTGIELHNSDGRLDFWRWVTTIDQSATLRLGDPGWPLSDYRDMPGKVLGVGYRRDAITLELGGLTSLLEHRANPSDTVPICIGNVEGARPGPDFTWRGTENAGITLATLTVVRDRGASVGFTDDGDGSFTLSAAQVGEITYETEGWKGANVADSDQTYGIDGVLEQFLLHHTELTAAEINLPTGATLAYPDYEIEDITPVSGFVGGVFVEAGSNKTAFQVCAELARSALRTLTGISGQLALSAPTFGVGNTELHASRAEQLQSVAIRRADNGVLYIDYAKNPQPLTDVAADTAGSSIWRRDHLYRSTYGSDAEVTGEYPFAPYREIFSAPWLRSFSAVDGLVTNLEIRYQRELAPAFAQEVGLWRVEFDYIPWRASPGGSYRIFAPEFPTEGAICHVTGRGMGNDNYLLVLTNGH